MQAAQVVRLSGPDGVEVREVPEPSRAADEVSVEVHATGVSFPDLLLTRGEYQLKPDLPFTLGVDFAGRVREAPADSGFAPGQRVAGWGSIGAAAELAVTPPERVFPLPDAIDFAHGAAMPLNYLTAHFALLLRGGLQAGEWVLVHGAGGGVGTATVQMAKAYGASVVAVASTPAKQAAAAAAGADDVLTPDDVRDWLAAGTGVDVVVDVVGSQRVVGESLRALRIGGRLLVVGFAGGEIPTVKLNRLLLNNVDVRGVAWGPYTRARPGFARRQWDELLPLFDSGRLQPPQIQVFPLADVRQALIELGERRIVGKAVLRVR